MTTIEKPATIAAMDQLIDALRDSRERVGDRELTGEELDILAEQVRPIVSAVTTIDPDALQYLYHEAAQQYAEQIVGEQIRAGKLVRLNGGRVIESSKYDPAVHGPAA